MTKPKNAPPRLFGAFYLHNVAPREGRARCYQSVWQTHDDTRQLIATFPINRSTEAIRAVSSLNQSLGVENVGSRQ